LRILYLKVFTKVHGLAISDEIGARDKAVIRLTRAIEFTARAGVKVGPAVGANGAEGDFCRQISNLFCAFPANHLFEESCLVNVRQTVLVFSVVAA
jgi:hypothetical protein